MKSLCVLLFLIFFTGEVKSVDYFEEIFNINLREIFDNPYRTLGVSKWSSLKEIKEKYNKLVKIYHPDKSSSRTAEKFMKIQQAYEMIKKRRNDKDLTVLEIFLNELQDVTLTILGISGLLSSFYGLVYFVFKLYDFFVGLLISLVISFVTIEKIFPHYFYNAGNQYFFSLIVGVSMYGLFKFLIKSRENV